MGALHTISIFYNDSALCAALCGKTLYNASHYYDYFNDDETYLLNRGVYSLKGKALACHVRRCPFELD